MENIQVFQEHFNKYSKNSRTTPNLFDTEDDVNVESSFVESNQVNQNSLINSIGYYKGYVNIYYQYLIENILKIRA